MNLRVVMTAGGTREPIDDVRHVSNVATGALPAAMAEALLARGATVHYIHGPGAILPARLELQLQLDGGGGLAPADIDARLAEFRDRALSNQRKWTLGVLRCHQIETAAAAAQTVHSLVAQVEPHLVACAMAVADFAPIAHNGKLSSKLGGDGDLSVKMSPTAKVIDGVRAAWPAAALLGFKLLSGASEAEHRTASTTLAQRSGARWVFSNDMADYRQGLRRGVLWSADGVALDRLHGGQGDAGRRNLADCLVAAVWGYLDADLGA